MDYKFFLNKNTYTPNNNSKHLLHIYKCKQ